MNVEYLIQLLENKMSVLNNAKAQAFMTGDLSTMNSLDVEIGSVTDTLYKLRLLLQVSQGTAMTNVTLAEAMKLQTNIITDGSTECLNEYDIEPYATDPLHEEKIADILRAMGPMISPEVIDAYIDSEAIASPVTGQMVLSAAQTYAVDVRLMMAIMELDSRFGTAGVATTTNNPGNVGNTGTSTQTYASWSDGVNAVADWLNRHRKTLPEVEVPVIEVPVIETPVDVPVIVPAATTTFATTTAPAPTPPPITSTSTAETTASSTNSTSTPASTPATTTPEILDLGSGTASTTSTTTPTTNE